MNFYQIGYSLTKKVKEELLNSTKNKKTKIIFFET